MAEAKWKPVRNSRWPHVWVFTAGAVLIAILAVVVGVSLYAPKKSVWRNLGYNVSVSTVGFLFSLSLAVGLYYLKRHHDHSDEADRRQEEIKHGLYRALVEERNAVFELGPKLLDVNGLARGLKFMFVVDDAEDQLTDPVLQSYVSDVREILFWFLNQPSSPMFSRWDIGAYREFILVVTGEVGSYLHKGDEMVSAWHIWQDCVWDSYRDLVVKETPGLP